ncbi:MAG: hypothetical protein ACE5O2_14510, partial [Armatimonadota bacterium]
MPSEEVAFLHSEKQAVLERWVELLEETVNPRVLSAGGVFSRDDLPYLYVDILRAFELNQYRHLNTTFDRIVENGAAYGIPAVDAKKVLYAMPLAGRDVLDRTRRGAPNYDLLVQRLDECRLRLKSVYCKRLSAGAVRVVREHMHEIAASWERDLPTEIISKHFAVVPAADLGQLVEDTLSLYLRMLEGEEEGKVPCPDDPTTQCTRLEAYLADKTEFFRERGFALGDIQKALAHFKTLLEPRIFET